MPDRDPSPVPVAIGELADQVDVHLVGAGADVQVDVDVAVVLARELEDAPDLPGVVRVVPGCSADHCGAPLQRRHHVPVGLRHVGPTLLRKDAQLEVDGPRVVDSQLLQGLEAVQADVGVDLHVGAHVGDAVENALLQGFGGPCVHVLHREPGLDRGYALHVVAGASGGRRASSDDARLVEVDVRLDEAGRDETVLQIERVGFGPDRRLDGGDSPAGDPDIHRRRVRPGAGNPGSAQHKIQIQGHEPHSHAEAGRLVLSASIAGATVPALAIRALRRRRSSVMGRPRTPAPAGWNL